MQELQEITELIDQAIKLVKSSGADVEYKRITYRCLNNARKWITVGLTGEDVFRVDG